MTAQPHRGLDNVVKDSTKPIPARYSAAYFQYLGKTRLTVVGSISGKRYRFNQVNDIVAVDPRDRRSLTTVPKLRQVLHP